MYVPIVQSVSMIKETFGSANNLTHNLHYGTGLSCRPPGRLGLPVGNSYFELNH
jgi:hypothetical protein